MKKEDLPPSEEEFYRPLIASYLKYGSVDKVFARLYQNPGVSYPHFHRILKKWGIVKSAGGNSRLTEAVYFFSTLVKQKLPLEAVYKTMPPSLKISAATLHRILHCVKTGLVRRYATGLIITPINDDNSVLIGKDISTPRTEIGKPFGSLSLPMTFSQATESYHTSILRVLQQEVITDLTLGKEVPKGIVPALPTPLITIDLADVRINIFHLSVPASLNFSSFKLTNLTFTPADIITTPTNQDHFRAGIPEIIQTYLDSQKTTNPVTLHLDSNLNRQLATLPAYQ